MKSSSPTLLVLRFRDLGLPLGETIRLHDQIISTHGSVWWGWWKKSGETVPGRFLQQLRSSIQSSLSTQVLLFDSGHSEIRYATCEAVVWDASFSDLPAPAPEQAPDYYRSRSFPVWFRFSKIGDVVDKSSDELQKFAYVRVDEFFASGESRYTPFYDKRVSSIEELKQQDRTMWFLRKWVRGDPTHTVSLVAKSSIDPTHFKKDYLASQSRNLLWVSDLHFGGGHHAFPLTTTSTKADLGQSIEDALREAGINDLAGVVVSGDITWKADPGEYEEAQAFMSRLARSPSVLDFYRFAICTGNHDLAFSAEPSDKSAQVVEAAAPETAINAYSHFYQNLFSLAPNEYLTMGRRYLLGDHFPVEIVCLNTSLLEQKKGWFQGLGFVGDAQLKHASREFGWDGAVDDRPRPFRIVVMHHHLVPVTYAEEPKGGVSYSVVLDAERVTRWLLANRVDLVLHGHMHQSFFTKIVRPIDGGPSSSLEHCIHVAGLGSSGVAQDHRGEFQNMFATLRASARGMRLSVYSVFPGTEQSKLLWSRDIATQTGE